jgi:uncharacterized membrane protein YphA (DoxX/SURF4 family)
MDYWQNKWLRGTLAVLRIGLGALFVYAAWTKLREPWALFAITLDAYHILPHWSVAPVSRAIPWFELALGLLLASGRLIRVSTTAATATLLLFLVVLVHSYAQGLEIDCGCFGLGERLSALTLLRDSLLLAVSLLLTIAAYRRPRPDTVAA